MHILSSLFRSPVQFILFAAPRVQEAYVRANTVGSSRNLPDKPRLTPPSSIVPAELHRPQAFGFGRHGHGLGPVGTALTSTDGDQRYNGHNDVRMLADATCPSGHMFSDVDPNGLGRSARTKVVALQRRMAETATVPQPAIQHERHRDTFRLAGGVRAAA